MSFQVNVRRIFFRIKIVFLAFVSLLLLIFFTGGELTGTLEARYDLWQGRYEIHGYGLAWGVAFKSDLLKVWGIQYRHVAGCSVNHFIIESTRAYNSVMEKAIKKDLGIDVDQLLKGVP